MIKTTATLCTSAGGFEFGAKEAGLKPLWGVEISLKASDYAEANHHIPVIVDDICNVDYSTLSQPYHLHVSTSCKNASRAKQGGEAPEDINAAEATARAIEVLQPVVFSLENVWMYRNFDSFKTIIARLTELNYAVDWWHINAADYGVPQTRKRLILIARRDGKAVVKPVPSHIDPTLIPQQQTLFGPALRPWTGWYEAIEDLIPTLQETEFAPWQLKRLRNMPELDTLFAQGGYDGTVTNRPGNEPAPTITANNNQSALKAFLMRGDNATQAGKRECRFSDEAAFTITNSKVTHKAFLVPGDNTSNGVVRLDNEPMVTVQTREPHRCVARAFIVNDQNGGTPAKRQLALRANDQPMFTIVVSERNQPRAWLPLGKVVKLNRACLRRLQSLPDNFQGDGAAIGNAVPPPLAKAICEALK